jgi:circadian clock protein KaiC
MKVSTGMKKLDAIVSGGFPENSVVLVSGGPGCGKTLFSLNFLLEGARKGERCCYITLSEDKEELLKACDSIKTLRDVNKYIDKNFVIEHIPMGRSNINIKRFVDIISDYPRVDRVVIDNVNKLLMFSASKTEYRSYLSELVKKLKSTKCSLMICETASDDKLDSGGDESFECDGVVQLMFLDLEEKPMRAILVHKLRYTQFDPKVPHEFRVSEAGLDVTETKVM